MRLQVIGELVKGILKRNPSFAEEHPQADWHSIGKMRDKISHHYLDLDAEIIFAICTEHLPQLKSAITKLL